CGAALVVWFFHEEPPGIGEVVVDAQHLWASTPINVQPFADAEVSSDNIIFRRHAGEGRAYDRGSARWAVVLVEGFEGGIALAIKWQRGLGKTVAHRFVHHFTPD